MSAPSGPIAALAPLATPLPPSPDGSPFTDEQWAILMSLMDTVIPRIVRASAATEGSLDYTVSDAEYAFLSTQASASSGNKDTEALDAYLAEKPSDSAEFQDLLMRQLVCYATEEQVKGLKFVLAVLNTRAGALLLTGYTQTLNELDAQARSAVLKWWRTHYLSPIRVLYVSITSLAKINFLRTSKLFPTVTGYTSAPTGYEPGPAFNYQFLKFEPRPDPATLEFDVVIVGSGVGGGVSAKNLAEAGFSVLVVDKAYYHPPNRLPMNESAGYTHLYENGGFDASYDASLSFIAGSNWGGGGSVNWSASLKPQSYVRHEWAKDRNLPLFETAEFQDALDRVCDRMGVSTEHIEHSHGNQVLLEGARKLGYEAKAVPQNTGGHTHSCGRCGMGCGAGEKQGPNVCWLPDAARAGAQFIEGYQVERVLFENRGGKKTAVGVTGLWTKEGVEREVVVKAQRVIVSAGSLNSPVLLMNSGLKNKHIGRNLYMHPANMVSAFFTEDVRPWEGAILTTVCTSFENLDGHGHGAKMEATCMIPTLSLSQMNWTSGPDWKLLAAKYRHMNTYASFSRDRDPGRILANPKRVEYTPSAFDRRHTLIGLLEMMKILLVGGAAEIHPHLSGAPPFIVDTSAERSPANPEFAAWLRQVEAVGNAPPNVACGSAHQMGSCRMSATEGMGVVDPEGRVWETKGLYVADASVFPSASGVNPMITNLAISDIISRRVASALKKERGERL
ncbi:hypothetical protein V492_05166 [Pseudogymnoascus sp. VKM F-4246]|nr:hypothetical protein V492_05166 [Pseudogymnoascus sp. VKM F-4246]